MQSQILAAFWVIDIVFFVLLILGTAFGIRRGFVAGILKFAGKWASLIIAFTFCVSFSNFLELCFKMTTGIANGIAGALSNKEAYAIGLPTAVTGAEISNALAQLGVGALPRWLIAISFASVEIPAGTTAAMLLGSVFAKWIAIVISFLLLIILVRLGALLLSKTFGAVTDKIAPLRAVNQVLGGVLGLLKMLFFIFLALLLCNWLPIPGLHTLIESSAVVGKIFASQWFQNATSYAISGQWFSDFLQHMIA